ncbi:hypothetical protein PHYC_02651 [Phycisphaerales bacterium]|nr:hypothetical protein PHYC_02651 [Phycisphaerales bacterium]
MRAPLAVAVVAALAASAAAQTHIMIPDSSGDRIMLFDMSGTLVDQNWIPDGAGVGYDWQTPKDVQQIGDEIWVTDQVSDSIARFTVANPPVHIATISGGLDNIRGMGRVGNKVYVSNSGTGNGAPGQAVVVYNLDGSFDSLFAAPDPFDCTDFNGNVLVADIAGDDLRLFDPAGNFLSVFHASDGVSGIDFPEQIVVANTGPAGAQEVWSAGFTAPAGIYRYDNQGTQLNYYAVSTGPRGMAFLSTGEVLFTESTSVKAFDPATGAVRTILSGGIAPQFPGLVTLAPSCDPDVNCDGSVNGFDIEATEQAVNGDFTNFCLPSADLNGDGSENGFDIETEEQRVNGEPC